jgi:hypothetical protein
MWIFLQQRRVRNRHDILDARFDPSRKANAACSFRSLVNLWLDCTFVISSA